MDLIAGLLAARREGIKSFANDNRRKFVWDQNNASFFSGCPYFCLVIDSILFFCKIQDTVVL